MSVLYIVCLCLGHALHTLPGGCVLSLRLGGSRAHRRERDPAAGWTEGKFTEEEKEEEEGEEDELVQDKWKRVEIFKCPGMPLLHKEPKKDA